MGAIQKSINQLLGTTSLSATFVNHALAQTRDAAEKNTNAAMERVGRLAEARGGEAGEELKQSVEEGQRRIEENRRKYENSIIGNIKSTKAEGQQADRIRGWADNLQTANRYQRQKADALAKAEALRKQQAFERHIERTKQAIADRAEQARKAEEFRKTVKSQQFADLVNNPKANATDVEKWRKQ